MENHPKRNLLALEPVSLSSSGYYGNSIDWTAEGDVDMSVWDMG